MAMFPMDNDKSLEDPFRTPMEEPQELPIQHRPATNVGWVNRTLCSALEEMRKQVDLLEKILEREVPYLKSCYILRSLIEEVQVYGNRMEAGLEDREAYKNLKEKYDDLEKEIKKLEEKRDDLNNKK